MTITEFKNKICHINPNNEQILMPPYVKCQSNKLIISPGFSSRFTTGMKISQSPSVMNSHRILKNFFTDEKDDKYTSSIGDKSKNLLNSIGKKSQTTKSSVNILKQFGGKKSNATIFKQQKENLDIVEVEETEERGSLIPNDLSNFNKISNTANTNTVNTVKSFNNINPVNYLSSINSQDEKSKSKVSIQSTADKSQDEYDTDKKEESTDENVGIRCIPVNRKRIKNDLKNLQKDDINPKSFLIEKRYEESELNIKPALKLRQNLETLKELKKINQEIKHSNEFKGLFGSFS